MEAIRARDEQGFTLLEIIVAISILGIILVAIGFSVGESFRHTTRSQAMVDRSKMTSFTARYFAEDVASSTTAPVASTTPACGTGTGVINIPRDGDTIAYVSKTEVGSTRTALFRRTCQGTTQTSQHVLGKTNDTFSASASGGATSTLTVSWSNPPHSFTLRGDRRLTS